MENVSSYTSLARPGEGVVYTPDPVAKNMVVTLLSTWFESQFPDQRSTIHTFLTHGKPPAFAGQALQRLTSATLCDPAVGEGVFFHALASRLRAIFPPEYQSALNTWMSTKITGWDQDADVIARIRDRLIPSFTLEHGDFLLSGASTKYDLIIANPPYVRQEKLEQEYKQKLRLTFKKIAPDLKIPLRADYYLYFLVAMCLRLKPGGVLTAIVPNGWLDNAFGQIFRELLLSRFSLRKIETLNRRRHFQAEVNTVIISVQHRRPG
ncbi:MAG: N-6 DNA methylase, partial [FCB group bacterium]|nr:N-6 DNA methylase [FCB group bacterium]